MATPLAQILQQISASYQPQKDVINQQVAKLDPQMQAEQKGLDAAKTDAFQQITDQSNRRGLLFSGIPLGEQAQYTGANYLPAVANLHSKYAQQKFNLQNALAQIDASAYKDAYGLYNQQLAADAARAGSAGAGGFSPSFGGGSATGGGQVQGANYTPIQALAYQSILKNGGNTQQSLYSDYLATVKSAGYGNAVDREKANLYLALYPWLATYQVQQSATKVPSNAYSQAAASTKAAVNQPAPSLVNQLQNLFHF